jgi:hypothetical protein
MDHKLFGQAILAGLVWVPCHTEALYAISMQKGALERSSHAHVFLAGPCCTAQVEIVSVLSGMLQALSSVRIRPMHDLLQTACEMHGRVL